MRLRHKSSKTRLICYNIIGEFMYRVVICDDEEPVRAVIREYLQDFAKEEDLELDILEFSSAGNLVEHYPENIDLLLLDIYMRGLMECRPQERSESLTPPSASYLSPLCFNGLSMDMQ